MDSVEHFQHRKQSTLQIAISDGDLGLGRKKTKQYCACVRVCVCVFVSGMFVHLILEAAKP